MEFNTKISLETKQVLSQRQVESLNILSMPVADLHNFLQNEEIENPLMEYSLSEPSSKEEVIIRDADSFYSRRQTEKNIDMESILSLVADREFSIEEFVMQQLSAARLTAKEEKIISYAVNCLDENGFLTVSAGEIGADLGIDEETVEGCLSRLKGLEPAGIFASGLAECLRIQVRGMEDEELLGRLIDGHLRDIAEGKLSSITRSLGIPSVRARKLIAVIKGLNPRPLNGFSGGATEYIIPDVIFRQSDGQWLVELGDRFGSRVGVNEFYVKMMDEASDQELKAYFEEKLKRVRFIAGAVEQRRATLTKIAGFLLERQEKYFLNQAPLRPMTLEEAAQAAGLSKSTVSRAIKDKYISSPRGCMAMRELFSIGVATCGDGPGKGGEGGQGISRNAAKECLRLLVDGEDKSKPLSDEKLVLLLREQGIDISRRTVAKYRTELGIAGAFARKEL